MKDNYKLEHNFECKKQLRIIFFFKTPSLEIEGTVFHVFDKVKVKIMLDSSNLQHQKIRMALVEPQVRPSLLISVLRWNKQYIFCVCERDLVISNKC
jgi:hypothetical protein